MFKAGKLKFSVKVYFTRVVIRIGQTLSIDSVFLRKIDFQQIFFVTEVFAFNKTSSTPSFLRFSSIELESIFQINFIGIPVKDFRTI